PQIKLRRTRASHKSASNHNTRHNVGSTMAAHKPTRIGNSVGVILPKDMLARLNLDRGDTLHVTDTPDGLRLTPHDPRFAAQMKQVRRIAKKRRAVLRELAK